MLAEVAECNLSATTQQQFFSLSDLSILPQSSDGKRDLVSLDSFSVQHDGPLTALRRSSTLSNHHSALQKITFELGAAAVCLDATSVLETRSLLARFRKKKKSVDSTSTTPSAGHLASKLQAIPREVVLVMTSVHVSGTSEEGLYGVVALDGGIATCQCHLSTSASTSSSSTATSAASAASLMTGSATWKKLNCSIAPDVAAPPGVELQCSSSEIGLTASPDSSSNGSSGNSGVSSSAAPVAALSVNGRVKINAMHTRIKHWDLQELSERLSKLSIKTKKEQPTSPAAAVKTTRPTPPPAGLAISSYKLTMSLGQGSSLQFLDGDSECMWLSSLHSADLSIDRAFSSSSSSSAPTGLGVSFQATEIAMTTAQVGPHLNVPVDNLNKFSLEKVLAAKLVHIVYSPPTSPSSSSAAAGSKASDTYAAGSPSPFSITTSTSGASIDGGSCDITTENVHAVLHPASVGALADVSRALAALKPKTPKQTASSGPVKVKLGGEKEGRKSLPKLTFNFANTLLIAPATVTIPAAHSKIGRIQLVHSTLGASISTASGSIQLGRGGGGVGKGSSSSSGTGELALSDSNVVYSESLAAQKFPEDAQTFKSYVKSTIIGVRNGVIVQESTIPSHLGGIEDNSNHQSAFSSSSSNSRGDAAAATTSSSSSTFSPPSTLPLYKRRLKLDQLTAIADADAIGCAIQAADDILAMYQLLKASTRHNNSWSRLRSTTTPSSQQEELSSSEFEIPSGSASKRGSLTGVGTSGSELDAVDIVTLNERSRAAAVVDGGANGDGISGSRGSSEGKEDSLQSKQSQKIPLYVDITAVKFSLPLSADIEVSLEVDAMHAELAPARGVHLVRTEAMNLYMKGKTVLKWKELAASLHTNSSNTGSNGGAAALPLQPLHPMRRSKPRNATGFTCRSSMAASLSREMSLATDWSIHTSPGNSPTARAAAAVRRRQPQWPAPAPGASVEAEEARQQHAVPPSVEDTLPTGLLPYHRAGLGPWLPTQQGDADKSSASKPVSLDKNEDTEEQKAEYLGSGPRSSLDLHLCGFEFIVPYDREPGPTQRYAEMYFKAVSAAFTHSVKVLRKKSQQTGRSSGVSMNAPGGGGGNTTSSSSNTAAKAVAASLFPLQLNLRIDGFAFRFEHHPMEKWLAVHGPLLRQAALQEYLWDKAIANVQNVADMAVSPLHAGIFESAIPPSATALAAAAAAAAGGGAGGSLSAGPNSLLNEDILTTDANTTNSAGATAGATTTATGTNVAASEAGSSHSGGNGGGSSSGAAGGLGGDPGKEHAWEGLVRTLAAQYKAEALKAAAAKTSASTTHSHRSSSVVNTLPCDDLLIISSESIQILAVVCDTKTIAAQDAALRHIIRLDPASAAVELMGARKLHVDIVAHNFALNIASAPQPFISATHLLLSGPIAVAKQQTAPPTTSSRTLAVGAHRAVDIQTNVRGCKAPFKLYTDLSIEAKCLSVVFSPGYEPALAMLGMAGKRLAPSDPDKTAPRPPPVPWWDDFRYLWRGKARLYATPLRVVLAAHQLPTVDDTSERMLIRSTAAEVFIDSFGDHSINFQNLSCSFYQGAGVESPGGALLVLPFVHAPVAKLRMKLGWKLPKGRLPQEHHLFPASVHSSSSSSSGGPTTSLQAPILVAEQYKAEGLDVALEVYFGQGAVTSSSSGVSGGNGSGSGSSSSGQPQLITALTSSDNSHSISSATALGFLGDKQIAFLREFSRNMRSTPAHIKACAKRGTFFARKPRGGPPKKGLPRLLQLFKLSIAASPLEIVHFTTDPNDPSAGLRIGASSASFGAAWLLNQPMPSFLQLPPHLRKDSGGSNSPTKGKPPASNTANAPPATRSITQDFFLDLGDISMHRDDPNDDFYLPDSSGNGKFSTSGGASGSAGGGQTSTSNDPLSSSAFASDPYSLGHKGIAAAAAAAAADSSHSHSDVDADLEEGARHAAALLQSLVERRREATAKDSSVLSATTLTVSRRPKPSTPGGGDDDGGGDSDGGGDDADPSLDPVSAVFGQRKPRPLRVVVSNCRFLMDLGTRNAVWGAVSHMIAAFAAKPKTSRNGLGGGHGSGGAYSPYVPGGVGGGFRGGSTPAGRMLSPLGSLLSPAAISARHKDLATEVQRRISQTTPTTIGLQRASSSNSEIGATPETNELLSLLLQQREAAGGEIGSALPTPHASTGEELPLQDGGDGSRSHYSTGGGYIDGTEDDEDSIPEGDAPMTTPLDDVHSTLRYEVEVNDLQVMMMTTTESGPGPGRLLLAAKSGRLRGLTLPDGPIPLQITTLGLEDVQAYVSITDIDPHISLSWLHVDKSGFSAPEDGGPAALRRVFNPICIDMRHSKAPSSSLTTRRAGSMVGMRQMSLRSPTPGGGFGGSMMKTDELILKVRKLL